MGQFFKFLFASCLGVLLAIGVIAGISISAIASLASEADKPKAIQPNSVLKLTLNQALPERTNNTAEVNIYDLKQSQVLGIHDIIYCLEQAKEDDNIKGIYLEVESIAGGIGSAKLLQDALEAFQESGKFIISYGRFYSQGAYFLSSVADEIIVNPIGVVDFRGFSAQIPFFKNMLDKVGVNMQVVYAGKFKSATEPYRRTNMSDENRLQVREYLDEMYAIFLEDISKARGLEVATLHQLANDYVGIDPLQAQATGLVDKVGYADEAHASIREAIGLDSDEDIKFVSLNRYFSNQPKRANFKEKNRIAVVYAEGTIVDGKGESGSVGDEKYVKILRKLRENDKVKAIVLRVNSGGGSAMSSENIWREVRLAQEEGKIVVASMGDYAASGGYYIAAPADTIVAQSNTLTGSIGVFSVIPSLNKMLNDKVGINFDTVKTADLATGISFVYDMSPAERAILQARTNEMYEIFLKRVSDGRGMSRDEVHEIAQGRVWTGNKAKEIGLVDEIGDLEDAIAMAEHMAGLEGYRLMEYPAVKEPLQQLLEEYLLDEEVLANTMMKAKLGDLYPHYEYLKEISDTKGVQARLPFIIPFE
ncbi:MAG: signal peptide peptidase SppA [Bacteroidota bacterium]